MSTRILYRIYQDGTQALPTYFPGKYVRPDWTGQYENHWVPAERKRAAILKEDNEQDATVFLRSATLKMTLQFFSLLKTGLAGVGAVSPYCMKDLRDDHMYLSKQGVFAITTNAVTCPAVCTGKKRAD